MVLFFLSLPPGYNIAYTHALERRRRRRRRCSSGGVYNVYMVCNVMYK